MIIAIKVESTQTLDKFFLSLSLCIVLSLVYFGKIWKECSTWETELMQWYKSVDIEISMSCWLAVSSIKLSANNVFLILVQYIGNWVLLEARNCETVFLLSFFFFLFTVNVHRSFIIIMFEFVCFLVYFWIILFFIFIFLNLFPFIVLNLLIHFFCIFLGCKSCICFDVY